MRRLVGNVQNRARAALRVLRRGQGHGATAVGIAALADEGDYAFRIATEEAQAVLVHAPTQPTGERRW